MHPARAISDEIDMKKEETNSKLLSEEVAYIQQHDEEPTFEDVIEKLGNTGRYQFIQCALSLCPMMGCTFMILGFVFIGYTPPHVCNKVNETELLSRHDLVSDVTATISYGECDITVYSNRTGNLTEITSFSCPNGRNFPSGRHLTLVSEWDLVCEKTGQAEIMAFANTIGKVIGGLFLPAVADRFGRKPLLCTTSILSLFLHLTLAFAPNLIFMCAVALIEGVAYSGTTSTYMVLAVEMLKARHRQTFGILACQYWVVCILVVGGVAFLLQDISWRYFQAVGALTGLLTLAMPFFINESPRWLAINGRPKEALAILEQACKQNSKNFAEVKQAFTDYANHISRSNQQQKPVLKSEEPCIKNDVLKITKKQQVSKFALLTMLTRKDTLILLLVMWFIWTTNNLTYYGIFMSSSNLAGNRFLNFCLLAFVEIPCNFLVLYMMNKIGRLQVLRTFLSLAAVSLLCSLLFDYFGGDSSQSEITSVVLFIFGKFSITCSFNSLYVFTPELFPTVLRATGNGSCKSVSKLGAMFAPYLRPLYFIAKWAPGLIFTSMCFISVLLSFLLPEMKDKALPTRLSDVTKSKNKSLNRQNNKLEDSMDQTHVDT